MERALQRFCADADNVKLVALFSPEHGLEGRQEVARIADSVDAKTGLRVFSLYGDQRQPTAEMLADVDTLVFDIQDVGARFYTYISTMGLAMKAAADNKKRFVVLDRPNPINGVDVAGPMLDPGKESFVGFHRLPVRHGMTIGELAMMFRDELKLDLDLDVVRCEGWRRSDYWDATGLPWVNPSPNMRRLSAALLYPGVGLFETTNISVGRGTDTPFEVVGAPWLDGAIFAEQLSQLQLPGVCFVPVQFTPTASEYAQQECSGVNLIVIDREQFEPLKTAFAMATILRDVYPDKWQRTNFNRLLGNDAVFEGLNDGQNYRELYETAQSQLSDFRVRRNAYLLYP